MVAIYSKPNCPTCEDIKAAIQELGIEYLEIDAQAVIEGELQLEDTNQRNEFTAAYMDWMELPVIWDGQKCHKGKEFINESKNKHSCA